MFMGEPCYDGFDTDQLGAAMDQLNGLHNAALWQLLRVVAAYERKSACESDGMRTMAEWLCTRYGVGLATARSWVEAASALEDLPQLSHAFAQGRLSFDKLSALLPIASADNEAELLEQALSLNLNALKSLVRRQRPVTKEEDAEAHEQRSLRWTWDERRNRVRLWGHLRADQGATVVKALERCAHLIGRNPNGSWDPLPQRAADALVELCGQALSSDSDADRASVVIHADASALVAAEGSAETEEGFVLSSEALRRSCCDCRLQIVAHDEDGETVGIGRLSRSVRRWLVRQLRARDQGCVFPGCNRRRYLQAHHVWHWIRGGPTDLDNLCLLCGYHHYLVHEGGWKMKLNKAEPPVFYRPNGLVFEPAPEPLCDEIFSRFLWDVEPEPADTS
jgi:hypothetical protein